MHSIFPDFDHSEEIPKEFYSEETGRPFTNCLVCDCELLHSGKNYLIEKAIKQYPEYNSNDVIFEYAICLDCADKMREQLSEKSQENIQNYFLDHIDSLEEGEFDFLSRKEFCFFKGTPKEELKEYQIFSMFLGNKMIPSPMPYLIGEEAIHEMAELLSKETQDDMNGFIDRYFGLPPELKDILKDNKVVLL